MRSVYRLPPEILTDIFERCPFRARWLAKPVHHIERTDTRLDKTPLFCASVCQQWRYVALNTPQLWSLIAVNPQRDQCGLYDLMQLWLSRAGNSLLSLCIKVDSEFGGVPGFMELFASRSHFWHNVLLQVSQSELEVLSSVHGQLPNLQMLKIYLSRKTFDYEGRQRPGVGGDGIWFQPDPIIVHAFSCAPQLRSFEAIVYGEYAKHSRFTVPWVQLRSILLGSNFSARDQLDILKSASGVELCNLSLTGESVMNRWNRLQVAVELPQLHQLVLRTSLAQRPSAFLAALRLPIISELYFHAQAPDQAPDVRWDSWTVALTRLLSGSLLQKLTISCQESSEPSDEQILEILQVTNHLQELSLITLSDHRHRTPACLSPVFLRRIRRRDNSESPALMPELHTLTFTYDPRMLVVDMVEFAEIIESRISCIRAGMKSVHIRCPRDLWDQLELSELKALPNWPALRAAGADVRITQGFSFLDHSHCWSGYT